ncbi:MAG: FkbM family methyltransferase [Caldivirga sp.]
MYLLYRLGLINNRAVKVILKDGCEAFAELDRFGRVINAYYDGLISDIHCLGNDFYVDFMGLRFRDVFRSMVEVFVEGQWGFLDVRGRQVIDVGAFNGNSAIYFALKGTKKVFAVEPHPGAFAEMLDNIRLNNLENVIIPINAGLASKPGKICIENVDASNTFAIYHRPGDCPNAVPVVTLSELISRFSINVDDAVLKMDCEGCEFDVVLNDYEHVRLFRELILEYHPKSANKSMDDLLMTLNRDYKCEVRGGKDLGIMHCIRK